MAEKRLVDAMKIVTRLSKRISVLILPGAKASEVYDEMLKVIAEAPTEDAAPVVHGRWKPSDDPVLYNIYGVAVCSVCGYSYAGNDTKYCPDCGAKMDAGKRNGLSPDIVIIDEPAEVYDEESD